MYHPPELIYIYVSDLFRRSFSQTPLNLKYLGPATGYRQPVSKWFKATVTRLYPLDICKRSVTKSP